MIQIMVDNTMNQRIERVTIRVHVAQPPMSLEFGKFFMVPASLRMTLMIKPFKVSGPICSPLENSSPHYL